MQPKALGRVLVAAPEGLERLSGYRTVCGSCRQPLLDLWGRAPGLASPMLSDEEAEQFGRGPVLLT